MTYEDVISLGWKDRHPHIKSKADRKNATFVFESPGFDYHIMSVHFDTKEDDGVYDFVDINLVPEGTLCNEWENSETHFNGYLKTKEELNLVMQFLGIIDYKGLGDMVKNSAYDAKGLKK